MGYLALYRKYRPSGFDGVIGQDHIIQTLVNQIKHDRLGHAYLFTGTRGTGKTSIAKIFAKAINCKNPKNGSPCGKCECCIALNDPSNIDVIEIDAASNNGVNEIRDIRENVQYPPVSCRYKVYIVDEVHMLSGAAFNALLKTLEEPPKHAVFILATTEVHKIPATILSRCMRFDFRLVATEVIASLIADIYNKEGKKFDNEAVFAIAKAGEGSVRDALSIADICLSASDNKLTYDDVLNVLGATNDELVEKLISDVLQGKTGECLQTVNELISLGKSIGVLVKDISAKFRDILICKTCKQPNSILGLPEHKFNSINKIAYDSGSEKILRSMEIFTEIGSALRYSSHPRIVFENAIIKASRADSDLDIVAIQARITELENKIKAGIVLANSEPKTVANAIIDSTTQGTKLNINDYSSDDLKGKLLLGLRKIGSNMLWNILQEFSVSSNGNVLIISATNQNDYELLNREENKNKIKKA